MSATVTQAITPNFYLRAGAAALAVLVLTSVHHVYGAIIYDTPWRAHIVYIVAPVGLIIAILFYVGWSGRGTSTARIATWIGAMATLAFPVAAIGVYEGGYNHVVKNLAYFVFGEGAARRLFPGEAYEMPSDFIFEATGVAQFPLAVLTAVLVVRLLRTSER